MHNIVYVLWLYTIKTTYVCIYRFASFTFIVSL